MSQTQQDIPREEEAEFIPEEVKHQYFVRYHFKTLKLIF